MGLPLPTSRFWELITDYRYRLPVYIGNYVGNLVCLVLWTAREPKRPPSFFENPFDMMPLLILGCAPSCLQARLGEA